MGEKETGAASRHGDGAAGHGSAARWAAATLGVVTLVMVGALAVLVVTTPSPDPRAGWTAAAELPEPRGEVGATVADRGGREVLILAGGFQGPAFATSTAVHLLDPVDGMWQQLPDLPAPRHHPAVAALKGDIYVSGGAPSVVDWTPQDTLWVLRDGATGWEQLAAMPEGRDSHRMRVLDGRLHVVGGHGASADTLVYDPDSDDWSRAAPLPTPRHHLAVVAYNRELWAIGGRDDDETVLDAVHVWDPDSDAWRDGPTLPSPVSAAVEGVLDGTIHLVGGEDPAVVGGGIIDDHLVLDPEAGSWQRAEPAPVSVHGAGGGVIAGRLVVAGGAKRQGALSALSWTGFTASYHADQRRGAGWFGVDSLCWTRSSRLVFCRRTQPSSMAAR